MLLDTININPKFTPILQQNKGGSRPKIKNFDISYENKQYELIVLLIKNEKEKEDIYFNFVIKEKNPEDINISIYFEQNKKLKELIELFPKSKEKK